MLHRSGFSSRCQQVVEKAFESWNDTDQNRRFRQMRLVLDVPPDYEAIRKTRSVPIKRKRSFKSSQSNSEKPKHPRAKAIKCE